MLGTALSNTALCPPQAGCLLTVPTVLLWVLVAVPSRLTLTDNIVKGRARPREKAHTHRSAV